MPNSREAAQMPAPAASMQGLGREAPVALLRVRIGPECPKGNLRELIGLVYARLWQSTPVFLPGESQRWGSLVGCRLWGHTESDTTEAT